MIKKLHFIVQRSSRSLFSYKKLFSLCRAITLSFLAVCCASYENFRYITDEVEIPTKTFLVDYNQTWQAIIVVMKKYDIENQNQETGLITTRWIDNTSELNFADSFASSDTIKGAKFRLSLNALKSLRNGKEVTQVSVTKRQLVEQDFLQGWKEIPTDYILEKTLLYRIERTIQIDRKLRAIEEKNQTEQIKNF